MSKMHSKWLGNQKRKAVSPPEAAIGCSMAIYIYLQQFLNSHIVQELCCESRGGRPELSVLTSLTVSVDVKNY